MPRPRPAAPAMSTESVNPASADGDKHAHEHVPWLRYVFGTSSLATMRLVSVALPQIVVACGIRDDVLGCIGLVSVVMGSVAGLFVGYAADHYDLRGVMALALVAVSAATAWLAVTPRLAAYVSTACCLAMAYQAIASGTVYKLAKGSDHEERVVVRFLMMVAASVTVLPLLAGWAIRLARALSNEALAWRWAVGVAAVLQLAWLFLIVRTPRECVPLQHRPGWSKYRRLLKHWRIYALTFLSVLQMSGSGAGWYWCILLAKRKFPQIGGLEQGLLLSVMGSSLLVGRVIMLRRRRSIGLAHIAVLSPIGAAAMWFMVFWAPSFWAFAIMAWLTWILVSPNWPLLMAVAMKWFPETRSGAAGIVRTVGLYGHAASCFLVGVLSERTGSLATAFLAPIAMTALASVLAGAMFLMTRGAEKNPA